MHKIDQDVIDQARVEYMNCMHDTTLPYPLDGTCNKCEFKALCDVVHVREQARRDAPPEPNPTEAVVTIHDVVSELQARIDVTNTLPEQQRALKQMLEWIRARSHGLEVE